LLTRQEKEQQRLDWCVSRSSKWQQYWRIHSLKTTRRAPFETRTIGARTIRNTT
jgi:hypothetical protein